MTTRKQIIDKAREYVGTPFKHQGRHKGVGLDCVGLPIAVARDLGIGSYEVLDYGPQPARPRVLETCQKMLVEKRSDEIIPGDVICLALPDEATHVAIVSEHGGVEYMIHAYAGGGAKVVEHILSPAWRRRIRGVFRFPEVEE